MPADHDSDATTIVPTTDRAPVAAAAALRHDMAVVIGGGEADGADHTRDPVMKPVCSSVGSLTPGTGSRPS
jgi:hypothetical protein